MLILLKLWSTFIYCPLAHMVWSDTGFLGELGVLDFAGGTPVGSITFVVIYFGSRCSKTTTFCFWRRPTNR